MQMPCSPHVITSIMSNNSIFICKLSAMCTAGALFAECALGLKAGSVYSMQAPPGVQLQN